MFVNVETAQRIERAESAFNRAVASATFASGRAPRAFVREIGSGVGSYLRPGSPLNKVIGAGLQSALDPTTLAEIEAAMRVRDEPTRIELSTLCRPEVGEWLTARGYRLLGFENALVRPTVLEITNARQSTALRVERVTDATMADWRDTIVEATCAPDETGRPVDALSAETIATAIDDFAETPGLDRYLAYLDGALAGAATLHIHDGVALLGGSATLSLYRRRGVQSSLIAFRLLDARARGAELAVVTTAPGSQSQANVMKHGFSLAYARAILVSAGTVGAAAASH